MSQKQGNSPHSNGGSDDDAPMRIGVAARVRPRTLEDLDKPQDEVIQYDDGSGLVSIPKYEEADLSRRDASGKTNYHQFSIQTFLDSTQGELYEALDTESRIKSVLNGGREAIVTLGQEKTGKTYSLYGSVTGIRKEEMVINRRRTSDGMTTLGPLGVLSDFGLIPRIIEHLFDFYGDDLEVSLRMIGVTTDKPVDLLAGSEAVKEIYNGQVDKKSTREGKVPFSPSLKRLKGMGPAKTTQKNSNVAVRHDAKKDVFLIQGASVIVTETKMRALGLLEYGLFLQSQYETQFASQLNSVIHLKVHNRKQNTNGLFTFVDLAGSTSGSKNVGSKSLFNLNQMVKARNQYQRKQTKEVHANLMRTQRSSKLNMVLKEPICGNTRVFVLGCMSPDESALNNTLRTLQMLAEFIACNERVKTVADSDEFALETVSTPRSQEVSKQQSSSTNDTKTSKVGAKAQPRPPATKKLTGGRAGSNVRTKQAVSQAESRVVTSSGKTTSAVTSRSGTMQMSKSETRTTQQSHSYTRTSQNRRSSQQKVQASGSLLSHSKHEESYTQHSEFKTYSQQTSEQRQQEATTVTKFTGESIGHLTRNKIDMELPDLSSSQHEGSHAQRLSEVKTVTNFQSQAVSQQQEQRTTAVTALSQDEQETQGGDEISPSVTNTSLPKVKDISEEQPQSMNQARVSEDAHVSSARDPASESEVADASVTEASADKTNRNDPTPETGRKLSEDEASSKFRDYMREEATMPSVQSYTSDGPTDHEREEQHGSHALVEDARTSSELPFSTDRENVTDVHSKGADFNGASEEHIETYYQSQEMSTHTVCASTAYTETAVSAAVSGVSSSAQLRDRATEESIHECAMGDYGLPDSGESDKSNNVGATYPSADQSYMSEAHVQDRADLSSNEAFHNEMDEQGNIDNKDSTEPYTSIHTDDSFPTSRNVPNGAEDYAEEKSIRTGGDMVEEDKTNADSAAKHEEVASYGGHMCMKAENEDQSYSRQQHFSISTEADGDEHTSGSHHSAPSESGTGEDWTSPSPRLQQSGQNSNNAVETRRETAVAELSAIHTSSNNVATEWKQSSSESVENGNHRPVSSHADQTTTIADGTFIPTRPFSEPKIVAPRNQPRRLNSVHFRYAAPKSTGATQLSVGKVNAHHIEGNDESEVVKNYITERNVVHNHHDMKSRDIENLETDRHIYRENHRLNVNRTLEENERKKALSSTTHIATTDSQNVSPSSSYHSSGSSTLNSSRTYSKLNEWDAVAYFSKTSRQTTHSARTWKEYWKITCEREPSGKQGNSHKRLDLSEFRSNQLAPKYYSTILAKLPPAYIEEMCKNDIANDDNDSGSTSLQQSDSRSSLGSKKKLSRARSGNLSVSPERLDLSQYRDWPISPKPRLEYVMRQAAGTTVSPPHK
eukprot:gb/GECG01011371.1/.p1 GENE.gb/GECG01011371.1/~~gb/GECG01011371.1/.p1  ORF type:complete len:1405 (+),score=235.80 gb/GECG01011371.1/:1-4215(+)